jgi:hypothetical protein
MLLTHPSGRDLFTVTECDGYTKLLFTLIDTFAVMSECSVSKVCIVGLRLIEPVMNREVVAYLPSPLLHTTQSMMIGMTHL